jgi:hypothetical protein
MFFQQAKAVGKRSTMKSAGKWRCRERRKLLEQRAF